MFKIVTDSTTDLPKEYFEKHHVGCMHLSCLLDGQTYGQDRELPVEQFYEMMRQGKLPTTSQINPDEAKKLFEYYLEECKEILYLAFSSGLSGTYNSVCAAAQELVEEREDCRIIVIDTLAASMGEGLVVYKAVALQEAGKSMDEVAQWVREHLQNFVHVFTVDDLFHLHRGGRVSRGAAVLGTLAGIKPKLHVDEEGHLIVLEKVRGRKKSLNALVDYMEENMGSFREQNDIVFISHSDASEDAEYVREQIKRRFGIEKFMIHYIGPVIGSHTGVGTVALFFMGERR